MRNETNVSGMKLFVEIICSPIAAASEVCVCKYTLCQKRATLQV